MKLQSRAPNIDPHQAELKPRRGIKTQQRQNRRILHKYSDKRVNKIFFRSEQSSLPELN